MVYCEAIGILASKKSGLNGRILPTVETVKTQNKIIEESNRNITDSFMLVFIQDAIYL
jgi:hypothetical protein